MGFPNAGKSTLLSVVSAAKPKIADYPFTTLVPNLGMVSYRDSQSFVMADIPGIIKGASEGKGLGLRFLRHIERNSSLLFLVPADADNILEEYHILLNELEQYNPEMLDKKRILAISKSDMLDEELMAEIVAELPKDIPHIFISSVTNYNIQQLKDLIWHEMHKDGDYRKSFEISHRNLDVRIMEDDEDEWDDIPEDDYEVDWDDEDDEDFDPEFYYEGGLDDIK